MTALLSIDQGTTSSRAILFSVEGDILATCQKELSLFYPEKGWVEQNPDDIWFDTLQVTNSILKENREININAIGITNQRETTIIWDRHTGEPVYNAIVWQDRRTAEYCAYLKDSDHENTVREKTGLLLDPYFSATKIKWILDHVDGARERADKGELAFGTVDSFLLWRLTNGKVHMTDATNASRTMLFNIQTQQWDSDLLDLFQIPVSLLPAVQDNCADFGFSEALEKSIPITAMAGDQQAALVGQVCFDVGMVKATYGTGCFALMNTGTEFKTSNNRLLTTVGYRLNGEVTYALEGAIFTAGAAIQWLRDNLEFFDDAVQSEALAMSVPDNNDVYFIPAFTGLGAPHWDPDARAMISGLTRESTKAHITRAALEAQAYQTADLMGAFFSDSSRSITKMRIDGGLVSNQFMIQFLSDILNCPVDVSQVTETTALGAAYLAGLQVGIFNTLNDIASIWKSQRRITPSMEEEVRMYYLKRWKAEVSKVL